jgi:hypothetical protein
MVRSIAISRNGDYTGAVFLNPDAPSIYADGEIIFLDRDGNVLWNFVDDYTVERIAMSDDGNFIYASGSPKLYSFARNGTLIGLNESQGRTWVLAAADDGSYAVAGGTVEERIHIAGSRTPANRIYAIEKDGIIPWNYSTRHNIKSIGISADASIIVNAAGYELSSFTRNGTLMWQLNNGPDITSVAMTSDGENIAVGSQYYVRLFNRSGSLLWRHEYDGMISDIGISDDGKLIIAGGSGGVYVFDQQGNLLWNCPTPQAIQHVSVVKSGECFAAGTTDTVYFFKTGRNATSRDPEENQISLSDTITETQTSVNSTQTEMHATPMAPPWIIVAVLCIFVSMLFYKKH